MIASCGADNSIILWDAETHRQLARLPGHTGDIYCLDFSADSRRLASGGADGTVKIWDVTDLRREPVLEQTWDPLGFLDEGQVVAVRPDATLQIWDVERGHVTGEPLPTDYPGQWTHSYHGYDFAPQTGLIAIGTSVGAVELWQVVTHKRIASWSAHSSEVTAVRFSSDARTLATGAIGGVSLWDVQTGQILRHVGTNGAGVSCVAFSPADSLLAICNRESITVYDLMDEAKEILSEQGRGAVTVAFSPDGKRLASASYDGSACLWAMPSGEFKAELSGHLMGVPGVAFAPDGKTVVTGSHDRTLRFWSLATGQELMALPLDGVHCLHRFSSDGTTLAVSTVMASGERSIHLYQAPFWREITIAEMQTEEYRTGNVE